MYAQAAHSIARKKSRRGPSLATVPSHPPRQVRTEHPASHLPEYQYNFGPHYGSQVSDITDPDYGEHPYSAPPTNSGKIGVNTSSAAEFKAYKAAKYAYKAAKHQINLAGKDECPEEQNSDDGRHSKFFAANKKRKHTFDVETESDSSGEESESVYGGNIPSLQAVGLACVPTSTKFNSVPGTSLVKKVGWAEKIFNHPSTYIPQLRLRMSELMHHIVKPDPIIHGFNPENPCWILDKNTVKTNPDYPFRIHVCGNVHKGHEKTSVGVHIATMILKRFDKYSHKKFQWNPKNTKDGHVVAHLCHNKECINPDHLELVSPDINTSQSSQSCFDCMLCPRCGFKWSYPCPHAGLPDKEGNPIGRCVRAIHVLCPRCMKKEGKN